MEKCWIIKKVWVNLTQDIYSYGLGIQKLYTIGYKLVHNGYTKYQWKTNWYELNITDIKSHSKREMVHYNQGRNRFKSLFMFSSFCHFLKSKKKARTLFELLDFYGKQRRTVCVSVTVSTRYFMDFSCYIVSYAIRVWDVDISTC